MQLGYTHKNGGFYWHMGPLHRVKGLPAYRRSKFADCGAYLGVENIVIPAAERLLRLEAGRQRLWCIQDFFWLFLWKFEYISRKWLIYWYTNVYLYLFAASHMRRFTLHAVLLLFMMDWGNRFMTMAVVHWSHKLWSEVWGILVVTGLNFCWTGSAFCSENNLGNFLCGKCGKVDIC